MSELTYMDCWHYIAPLIPITDEEYTRDIYVMTFHALQEAEDRKNSKKEGWRWLIT